MKRERKHEADEYQIWSGTSNAQKRGTYIVYWKGMEIKRCRYFSEAQNCVIEHRYNQQNKRTAKVQPLTQETDVWLDGLLNGSQ